MRADAQRSSAANSDGSAHRGSVAGSRDDAGRALSRRAEGSGARSSRRARLSLLAMAIAAFAALALAPGASALQRDYESSFPTVTSPSSVAVDDSNGDTYVADPNNLTVSRYDAAGNARDFTAGPDATTNTLTGFGFASPGAIEVAVDSGSGRIYVTDSFGVGVAIFDNDGTPAGALNGASTPNGAYTIACGVAVDQSTGDVYVGDINDFSNSIIWRYTPSGGAISESDYSGAVLAPGVLCNVAAANGHVYGADTAAFFDTAAYAFSDADFTAPGPNASPTATPLGTGVTAIAADPASSEAHLDTGAQVDVVDPSGAPLYSYGSGDFSTSSGVAAAASGNAYVSDADNNEIDVYAPYIAPAVLAATDAATGLDHTLATLNGHLDPGVETIDDCHFDYLTAADYAANGNSYTGPKTPSTAPCAEGNNFAAPATVHANLTNLAPGATYHFRLNLNASASGQVLGDDKTFATDAFPRDTDAATAITHTTATFNGHFDPEGDANLFITECHFDWGTDTSYGQSAPCAEGNSFNSPASVHAAMARLHAGTTYHYRLHVTTASAGEFTGSDRSLTPPAFPTTTDNAGGISHTTATLNGHFDPQGDANLFVTQCNFEWGTDTNYSGGTVPCLQGNSFNSASAVSAFLANLHPGTTYHFRLALRVANGDTYFANDKTLTPTAFPVATDPATNLHHTNLTLNGHFDPQGDSALHVSACSFDWGATTAYGNSVPCAQGNSFTAAASVSAFLNNLTPGTTYHFRLNLTTVGAGQFTGADQSVTPPAFPGSATEVATFGADGTSATSFTDVRRLAFDQTDRRLYALEVGTGTNPGSIYGFDATSPPSFSIIVGFNPFATQPTGGFGDLTVDNTALSSAGNVYLSSSNTGGGTATGQLFGFDSAAGSLGGNFPLDPAVSPGAPAASPKFLTGVEVDSAGNIWVSNQTTGYLIKYNAAGVFQSALDKSADLGAANNQGPNFLAFDSADNLYVIARNGGVWRYTAASGYASGSQITSGATEIAVDSSNDYLYVARTSGVTAYDSTGNQAGQFATGIPGADFTGVAVDAINHYTYVSDNGNHKIRVFNSTFQKPPTITTQPPSAIAGNSVTLNAKVDPEGFAITDCHFEVVPDSQFQASGFTAATAAQRHACAPNLLGSTASGDVVVHADVSGLNGGATYHSRIVAANAQLGGTATGTDQSFDTTGPRLGATSVDHISDTAATLHASVNPKGQETTYRFSYLSDAAYQANPVNDRFAGADTAPTSPASIGSGNVAVALSEEIAGLDPATTYHFRVAAESSDAAVLSPEVTFTTYTTPPDFSGDGCSNDQFRSGAGADLPDCRAYEQASPVEKNGAGVTGQPGFNQAAADGHAAVFGSYAGLPTTGGSTATPGYVASRGAEGWSYDGDLASTDPAKVATLLGREENLRASLTAAPSGAAAELILTDLTTFIRQSVLSLPNTNIERNPQFADDTEHLIFEDDDALTADAADNGGGGRNLYDLDHGDLTLAGRVPAFPATSCDDATHSPDCVGPAAGSFAGSYSTRDGDLSKDGNDYKQNTISDDGAKVFFTEGATGRLYMRVDNTKTAQISADQGGSDPNGHKPAAFAAATPDGATVYFTSCEKLTPDSTAVSTAANACLSPAQGQDLYAYDTGSGELTDLTVDTDANPKGAQVLGMLGASPDGEFAYFVANGDLDGAGPATAGDCTVSGTDLTGACSLYLADNGEATFVARLGANGGTIGFTDQWNWANFAGSDAGRTSRVGAGGAILFSSTRSLSGYDNVAPGCSAVNNGPPGPCRQLYRYAPGDAAPTCVSCNPSGAAPIAHATLAGDTKIGTGGNRFAGRLSILTRNLSADGQRVFFESADKLLAADVNGDDGCPGTGADTRACQDVYMWEAQGSGSCESATQNGGCLYLLSSGTDPAPSFFADASATGDDAFIFTDAQLVPQDRDDLTDLYDVGVEGGLAAQHQVVQPPCEPSSGACEGAPSVAPARQGAGSAAFQGPSDPEPSFKGRKRRCPKGKRKVRRGGKVRCVRKQRKKKSHKRHHRRANSNRGGSK